MSPTRRDFLKGAAGVIAAGVVVPVAQAVKPVPSPVKMWTTVGDPRPRYRPDQVQAFTLANVKHTALSVRGVTRAHVYCAYPAPGEILVEVNANPGEVLSAIEKIMPPRSIVHVTGPEKIVNPLRMINQTIKIKFG